MLSPQAIRTRLNRAKLLLERQGWCQGTPRNAMGCHCLIGALAVACGYDDRCLDAFNRGVYGAVPDEVYEALGFKNDEDNACYEKAYDYNDALERTSAEVIALLDQASYRKST